MTAAVLAVLLVLFVIVALGLRALLWLGHRPGQTAAPPPARAARVAQEDATAGQPRTATDFSDRGDAFAAEGDFENAVSDYTAAIRSGPDESLGYNSLAWLRATCPESKFRDGKQALELAQKACELSSWSDGACLDTLAAAYAEVGRFDEAVKWQKQAIGSPDLPDDEREEARLRLRLYEKRRPFRDE